MAAAAIAPERYLGTLDRPSARRAVAASLDRHVAMWHPSGTIDQVTAAIEIDNQETWPDELVTIVDESRDLLIAWQRRQSEIDDLCEECVSARWNRPRNEFSTKADDFVAMVDRLLMQHQLVARHCTRLTDAEIAKVTSMTGVEPLSTVLVQRRLEGLRGAGIIGEAEFATLTAASQAAESNRRGMTWWILDAATLRDCSSVARFLRQWGGEAIFWQHESGDVGHLLRTIGYAAIVEAAIPRKLMRTIGRTLGETFRLAIANGELPTQDAVTDQAVRPEMVQRVVRYGTPEFEVLTGASSWGISLMGYP
jgi:hypothetical protein